MTELGISLGVSPREPYDRFVSLLKTAEACGVNAAWVIDSQLAMKDCYVALALAARETSRLRLGPGVTNAITRHETVVANAMASLDSVAPGRVLVGFGAGDSAVFPLGLRPSSIDSCRSKVEAIRQLLAGREVPAGTGNVRLAFVPDVAPPVYLAASQPRMLRLAGQVADGVIIMGPADAGVIRTQMELVDEGARSVGRPVEAVHRDVWVTLAVGDDRPVDSVKSWASAQARWLSRWEDVPPSLEPYREEMAKAAAAYEFGEHLSLRAGHADLISDDFARALAVAGDFAECSSRLGELAATGVDRVTLTLLSGGREGRLADLEELWGSVSAGLAAPA